LSTIAVTELEYQKAKSVFEGAKGFKCIPAPKEESGLTDKIKEINAQHVIIGVDKYNAQLYESLPKGGVIARFGVGHDGVDKEKATNAGLFCTNTPGALDDSVAEFTIGLLLVAARQMVTLAEDMKKQKWQPQTGLELKGKTLAIIGCGPIGCKVAKIASFGFNMNVIGNEIAEIDESEYGKKYGFSQIVKDFDKSVLDADFVSLHIPSTTSTFHFIDNKALDVIPQKAWLINTARGAVIDEIALYHALNADKIKGAVLDVYESEPYIPAADNADLRTCPNAILYPHVSSSTKEACYRMAEHCLRNIEYAQNKDFNKMNLLNPQVL
jgi:phosphoglycerate dehydrogenase-like enzyme